MVPLSKQSLRLAIIGASCFWIPDVIVHGIAGYSFGRLHTIVVTFLMPVCMFAALAWVAKQSRQSLKQSTFLIVSAVWILGGAFMLTGATFSGGGFAQPGVVKTLLLSFIPVYTFVMATYDGSLFALLIATLVPLIASVITEKL